MLEFIGNFFYLIYSTIYQVVALTGSALYQNVVNFLLLTVVSAALKGIVSVVLLLLSYILIFLLCIVFVLFVCGIILFALTATKNKPKADSFRTYLRAFFEEQIKKEQELMKRQQAKFKSVRFDNDESKPDESKPDESKPEESKGFWGNLMETGKNKGQAYMIEKMLDTQTYDIYIGYIAFATPKKEAGDNENQYLPFVGIMNRWWSLMDITDFFSKYNPFSTSKVIRERVKID